MDFHTHPPPSRVKFFTGPLEWNFPQPSCITGTFCLWLELRPPGGKFIASSRWSVAIKIKPAILHPATLHSTIRSPPLWLKLPALSAEIRQANSTHISNGCPTVICGNCPAVQLSSCPSGWPTIRLGPGILNRPGHICGFPLRSIDWRLVTLSLSQCNNVQYETNWNP